MGTGNAVALIEELDRFGEFAGSDQIAPVVTWFRSADSKQRAEALPHLTLSVCKCLLGFAFQCAEQAVRQTDPSLIELGLGALILENGKDDWRHSVIAMAVLYHSACRLDMDADEVFARVAGHAEKGEVQDEMTRFPKRANADRELAAFWLRESNGPEGFAYEQFRW